MKDKPKKQRKENNINGNKQNTHNHNREKTENITLKISRKGNNKDRDEQPEKNNKQKPLRFTKLKNMIRNPKQSKEEAEIMTGMDYPKTMAHLGKANHNTNNTISQYSNYHIKNQTKAKGKIIRNYLNHKPTNIRLGSGSWSSYRVIHREMDSAPTYKETQKMEDHYKEELYHNMQNTIGEDNINNQPDKENINETEEEDNHECLPNSPDNWNHTHRYQ
ncbi:uncharacterized protein LOC131635699 [Vicia villosa]|uniref:uncharacterized protein LOC131635699 n=1 Tax=Vicia villosa TaxID=3911 RepID=UPI00273A8DF9|nr:uncharacterized protein LOC131635699 [Vicia villosa]